MLDFFLTKDRPSGFLDIVITDGALQLIEDTAQDDELRQRVEFKLEFFRGDYAPNLAYGVPYYGRVLERGVNWADLYSIFTSAIEEEPGVSYVEELSIDIDRTTRTLLVDGSARSETGELIPINFISGGLP